MKLGRGLAVLVLIAGSISRVWSHGGGLDSCGGHHDRKNGGYHVHNQTKYCACHPDSSGCGGRASPPPASSTAASPQGIAAVPSKGAATTTVYVTATGAKYHREGCRYLTSSARATTLAEAAVDKTPCSVCKPSTTTGASSLQAVPNSPSKTTQTTPQPAASSQCAATTQKGSRCKRMASASSRYCWQHAK